LVYPFVTSDCHTKAAKPPKRLSVKENLVQQRGDKQGESVTAIINTDPITAQNQLATTLISAATFILPFVKAFIH
jgi:hypothetical protein